jgi:hypothetical protein
MSPHRGSQDAMEPQQMEAGGGNEHAEFLDELQRIKQQVRGAIQAGMGKLVQQLAGGRFRQPVERQGWAQEVAAQVLQLVAGVRGDGEKGSWPCYPWR